MEIMIDLETLGTGDQAAIVSIGLVAFDLTLGEITETLYLRPDVQAQLDKGASVTSDTISWWLNQNKSAKSVFSETSISPVSALKQIEQFFNQKNNAYVWGNGPTFDVVILGNMFKRFNFKVPWDFRKVMDFRTFRRFVAKGNHVQNRGVAHNALDDAKAQAEFILKFNKG